MTDHPLDAALALAPAPSTEGQAQGQALYTGHTSPAYWNMVGPFGGITAAVALQAVLKHPALLGEPVALTVNYAAAPAEGPITAQAVPARTNRSTQHWTVALLQTDAAGLQQVCTTATVVTALRRDTWAASDQPMPAVPAPDQVPRADRSAAGVAWLARYEVRPLQGDIPTDWKGQGGDSLSRLWLRDDPPRPLCFASLAALADVFFPRVWLRRALRVPVGTVSMTVYFHATGAQLAATGTGYLLGQAQAQEFRHGFFDQTGQLWNEQGLMLATTHQVVYYKE